MSLYPGNQNKNCLLWRLLEWYIVTGWTCEMPSQQYGYTKLNLVHSV